ncbi:hypothetical protein [Lachnotalea sp. AF33-28]|nr:hypothetical protein [Lachnotalea sp. AF33-28]
MIRRIIKTDERIKNVRRSLVLDGDRRSGSTLKRAQVINLRLVTGEAEAR